MEDDFTLLELGDNPYVCEKCKAPDCDCNQKCCTYCNGAGGLQLLIEMQEAHLDEFPYEDFD